MNLSKMIKWTASAVRLTALKAGLGPKVSWPRGGKPVYIGRGARIRVAEGGRLDVGAGLYLSENCLVQVNPGARAVLGEGVFMNANARIVAAESVRVGDHTMLGPNVCVYDHDHAFGKDGVSGVLVTSPVEIGERCWMGANSLVTRGARIADRVCVGGGAVVTRSLGEPGVYAGAPAKLVRRLAAPGGGVSDGLDEEAVAPQLGDCEAQVALRGGRPAASGQAEE